jgi:hypothetical protein
LLVKLKISDLPRWLRDVIPLILAIVLIFLFSSQSRLIDIESQAQERLFYKTAHMLAYAGLMWLWWRTLAPQRQITWSVLAIALIFTVLYAISDEIHQRYVPGRHGQVADVLFDTGGALAMLLLIRRLKWLSLFPESVSLFSRQQIHFDKGR